MTRFLSLALIGAVIGSPGMSRAADVLHLEFSPCPGVERAAIDCEMTTPAHAVRGLIVLVPGGNGSGLDMLHDDLSDAWREFSISNRCLLAALTFVSDIHELQQELGYYNAREGSGLLALNAIDTLKKRKGIVRHLPILMYGFSGGSHFTASFAEHYGHDAGLVGWCAAGFGEKRPLVLSDATNTPPGMIVCGLDDVRRWPYAQTYFLRGRNADRRWTLLLARNTGHFRSRETEDFTRGYFTALLADSTTGDWVSNGNGSDSWLPDVRMKTIWNDLRGRKSADDTDSPPPLEFRSKRDRVQNADRSSANDKPSGAKVSFR